MSKYKCLHCGKEFIVKEYIYQDGIVSPQSCPFCNFYDIEESAMCEADSNAVLDKMLDEWRRDHCMEKDNANDKGGFGYPLLGDVTEADEWFAAFAHSQWSGWMKHLFSMCFEYRIEPTLEEPDGELVMVIPKPAFKRWQRQMQIEYKDLTEEEKESDREEAAKIIQLILSRFA